MIKDDKNDEVWTEDTDGKSDLNVGSSLLITMSSSLSVIDQNDDIVLCSVVGTINSW